MVTLGERGPTFTTLGIPIAEPKSLEIKRSLQTAHGEDTAIEAHSCMKAGALRAKGPNGGDSGDYRDRSECHQTDLSHLSICLPGLPEPSRMRQQATSCARFAKRKAHADPAEPAASEQTRRRPTVLAAPAMPPALPWQKAFEKYPNTQVLPQHPRTHTPTNPPTHFSGDLGFRRIYLDDPPAKNPDTAKGLDEPDPLRINKKRRGWDSNPRKVALQTISSRSLSTTQPPLLRPTGLGAL